MTDQTNDTQAMSPSFQEAANSLNELLGNAEALFASRFFIPAVVKLPGGRELLFGKKDNAYRFVINDTPTRIMSIGIRLEVAYALPALWDACEKADTDQCQKLLEAVASVRAFIEEKSAKSGPTKEGLAQD